MSDMLSLDEILKKLKKLDEIIIPKSIDIESESFMNACIELERIYLSLERIEKGNMYNSNKFEKAYDLYANVQAKYCPACF